MVVYPEGVYSASNGRTKRETIMHHEAFAGVPWEQCAAAGDRLVRVEIKLLKKHKQ
jgi:hypothetical protein